MTVINKNMQQQQIQQVSSRLLLTMSFILDKYLFLSMYERYFFFRGCAFF